MPRDASAQRARPAGVSPSRSTDPSPAPSATGSQSASEMESLSVLLVEQGLVEYEAEIRAKGISEPHHLLRLTPAVIEAIIPDKPIHQRKLAALSRGRNLNAATFSMELAPTGKQRPAPTLGGAAPFRSKSADDLLPEKPGLRLNAKATAMPELADPLQSAISAKFGDELTMTVVKFLKLQGVVGAQDLKHCDMVVLIEQVKDAGAKPIQLGKLKDWVQTAAAALPALEEKPPPAAAAAAAVPEPPAAPAGKKRPPPKRSDVPRSNSANDVVVALPGVEDDDGDPMLNALQKRFGKFYGEAVQSFLMTQGVLVEDDLMVRDHMKMLTTAKTVGVKPVQLSKLKEWMLELKELDDGPATARPLLPHERRGSKLKLTKDKTGMSAKEYDDGMRASFDGVRASRASIDVGVRASRQSKDLAL
mmetsp:Transcript_7101/g.13197  ORF Transcript_7101/g.13197 Transcript_7101/m.13197 type:complete len:419 (-) Transcript_7101:198-1454(-)